MWIAVLGAVLYLALALQGPLREQAPLLLIGVGLGYGYLALVYRRLKRGRLSLKWFILTCLAVRLLWLPVFPSLSEDVYRHLWDGLLLAQGENPYLHAPEELKDFQRDHAQLYSRMAHRDRTSIYPPLAQLLFRLNHLLWGSSVWGWRLLLLMAEGFLLLAWRRADAKMEHLALWLLNPLVVLEFFGSAHLDLWAVALLIAAFVTAQTGRKYAPALLMAGGTLIKIFPAFALPALLVRWKEPLPLLRFGLFFALGVLLPTALLLLLTGLPDESWKSFSNIFGVYRSKWRFNSPLFLVYEQDRTSLQPFMERAFLLGTMLLLAHRPLRRLGRWATGRLRGLRRPLPATWWNWTPAGDPLTESLTLYYFIMMLLYTCSHTVHPWYVSWGLAVYPLLGLRYWAGIYLSGASFLSYLGYWFAAPQVEERLWLLLIEWIPFYLLLARDLRAWLKRGDEASGTRAA